MAVSDELAKRPIEGGSFLEQLMTSWREWLYNDGNGGKQRIGSTLHQSALAPREILSPVPKPIVQQVTFNGPTGTMQASLFVPTLIDGPCGLLLMLHGGGQTVDDFAISTAMAQHAEAAQMVVLYPAQSVLRNGLRCWNWFDPGHQQRGTGEPALLVDVVRQVLSSHNVDPRRVYVAGLSAGAAMAVTLGRTYPDIFAAVGCHSGPAYGTATDALEALEVMRSGPLAKGAVGGPGVPTIVFQGTDDDVVHPSHAKRVLDDCLGTASVNCQLTRSADVARNGHPFTRTVYTDLHGRNQAEYWEVRNAGHAWFGGCAQASFADPEGPDASREMLRFFNTQKLRPRLVTQ